MSETLLDGPASAATDTGPEVTPLGEGRMVREDCWREVHRLFHVERRSKSEIARQLALDRKTVRGILHLFVYACLRTASDEGFATLSWITG